MLTQDQTKQIVIEEAKRLGLDVNGLLIVSWPPARDGICLLTGICDPSVEIEIPRSVQSSEIGLRQFLRRVLVPDGRPNPE